MNHHLNGQTHRNICQGRKVFVVDDNIQVREMVCFVLECEGMQVLQADGPTKALELVERFVNPPDLMICDICMPIMSGPELYQLVEQRFPAQPVLFISAYPEQYLECGSEVVTENSLLRKPFGSSELLERVGQVLGNVKESMPETIAVNSGEFVRVLMSGGELCGGIGLKAESL